MPDEQHPNGPAYDWLYASGRAGRPNSAADPDATQAMGWDPGMDPDATQAMGHGGRADPDATQAIGGTRDAYDPEATQAMNAHGAMPQPGPGDHPGAGGHPDATQALTGSTAPSEGERQSFGGTYGPQQPSRPEPRFATPVQSRGPAARQLPPASPRPPARSGYGSTRPPRRKRNWWLRGALGLFLAWLVFLVAVPIWAWSTISKVDAKPAGPRPPEADGTTYLLVGSDSRAGLTKAQEADLGTGSAAGQRTDTIILLDVPASGPTLLLSIPRDSYVDIPGHGKSKINAAYSIGGPKLLVRTVEHATKVRIDNYIEIGFAGFVDVVDAVGGIDVCPKTSINDRKAGHLQMRKGCQHVNGHTALGYSRSRAFPNGDITRALHQREVIGAVGSEAASWQAIVLPWRYFRLNSAAARAVQVGQDVSPIDTIRFAWAMGHVGSSNTKRCVVPYSSLGTATSAGSAVIWDQQRANALFAAIRSGDTSSVHCAPQ